MNDIDIIDIRDTEDGGAIVTIQMSQALVLGFAKIGLLSALLDAADEVLELAEEIPSD